MLPPIPLPSAALPVDPKELGDAITLMSAAAAGKTEIQPQAYILSRIDPATGKKEEIRFMDTTFNRIMLALREYYRNQDALQFMSICWRLFALTELMRIGVLEDWLIPNGPGSSVIPDVVIEVAASLPLTGRQGFDPGVFLQALQRSP